MTFLNPAILFGLLAASIPVLIHLFNLRKLKKIEFSTLKFLKELQKNKIRKIKLKQWLLLALRVMIIILLVTAFARPTLEGVSFGGTSSTAKTTAVFILDDTFSMSVVDQNGSYFNKAKQIIKKLVAQLQDGDEAVIILVSSQPSEINASTNLYKLENELNEIKISSVTNQLNSALNRAAQIISESKNFNKEIYLLTDFQKGGLAEEEKIEDLSELLNENVKIYSFNLSGREVFNLSLSELKVNTAIFKKSKPINFSVDVTNFSNQPADNTVVSLYINGNRSAQKTLQVNPGETKTINMEAPINEQGYIAVTAEIEDDDILLDNKRYTSFYIPEKLNILLLYNSPDDAKYVELALSSSGNSENFIISSKSTSKLAGISLKNYNVIFFIGGNFISDSKKIKDYLNNNGGIVVFPSSTEDIKIFNRFLSSIHLPNFTKQIKPDGTSGSFSFDKIEFDHAVFEDIFLDENKQEIESPQIYSYYRMNTEGKGKSIITLVDGSSFLSEYAVDDAKVFLFNIAPSVSWSDFPLKSIFAPLMNRLVFYLSAKNGNNIDYLAGEKVNINISDRTSLQIRVEKPANLDELINIEENFTSQYLQYPSTSNTGNYKFFSGDKLLNYINVNTDPVESDIKYLTESDFDDYLEEINFKGSHIKIEKEEDPLKVILQARFGSELWRYFLIAALFFALIEMTIARNVKKELVEVKR